jgi:hypothetical protein
MPRYVITTISTHINRYAIEGDSEQCAIKEWKRLDDGEYPDEYPDCCEISQLHMGEEITNVMEVTDEDIVRMADDYLKDIVLGHVRKAPYQSSRGYIE